MGIRFKDRVVVVTGGANGIGRRTALRFEQEGARVYSLDRLEPATVLGDAKDPKDLDRLADYVLRQESHVDCIVHNVPPLFLGINACSYEQFMESMKIGPGSVFYLTQRLKPYLSADSSIVCVSSSRDRMSQTQSESYSAAKGAVHALTHALAASLAPHTRVNSVSPGWINTKEEALSEEDALQHPAGRVGTPDDVASLILFLCSQEASFITGENILIDGGMSHRMIYHNDEGWTYAHVHRDDLP